MKYKCTYETSIKKRKKKSAYETILTVNTTPTNHSNKNLLPVA